MINTILAVIKDQVDFEDEICVVITAYLEGLMQMGVNAPDAAFIVLKSLGADNNTTELVRAVLNDDELSPAIKPITTYEEWTDIHTANVAVFLMNEMEMDQAAALDLASYAVPKELSSAEQQALDKTTDEFEVDNMNVLDMGIFVIKAADILAVIKDGDFHHWFNNHDDAVRAAFVNSPKQFWFGSGYNTRGNDSCIVLSGEPVTALALGNPTFAEMIAVGADLGKVYTKVEEETFALLEIAADPTLNILILMDNE